MVIASTTRSGLTTFITHVREQPYSVVVAYLYHDSPTVCGQKYESLLIPRIMSITHTLGAHSRHHLLVTIHYAENRKITI